ncbi:unnamed protein product [Xylocopa violacea]|uniref:Uncharacterized protein n=1 Tax=Xylocopa violacea TaxID=135666 RepID=A0ABP1N8V3_XYLVO
MAKLRRYPEPRSDHDEDNTRCKSPTGEVDVCRHKNDINLRKLLIRVELGNKKPSELLRKMNPVKAKKTQKSGQKRPKWPPFPAQLTLEGTLPPQFKIDQNIWPSNAFGAHQESPPGGETPEPQLETLQPMEKQLQGKTQVFLYACDTFLSSMYILCRRRMGTTYEHRKARSDFCSYFTL